MADNLQPVGVKLVAEQEAAFSKAVNAGAKSVDFLQKTAATAGKILSTMGKALGNVAQIALGFLTRDLLRGIMRGVSGLFNDATDAIFGSADALKKLRENAAKAHEEVPQLIADLSQAKLKVSLLQTDPKASASDIVNAIEKVQDLEREIAKSSETINAAAKAQKAYANSLAGQYDVFRSKLVDVVKGLIERYLPLLTNAFQRLSPIVLNVVKQFANFLANPVFLAKAQQLVDWLSFTLPVALNKVQQAIQPVIDLLFGGGSWQAKLQTLGQSLLDWFESMVPQIQMKLQTWNRQLTEWIGTQAALFAAKLQNEWGPAFVNWITDPATLNRAGAALGTFTAWLLDQGGLLFNTIATSLANIFRSAFNIGVNGAGANSAGTIVNTFLGAFWNTFKQSQVFRQIQQTLFHLWLDIQREAYNAWNGLVNSIQYIITSFRQSLFVDMVQLRVGLLNAFGDLKYGALAIWQGIVDGISKVWADWHFAILSKYYDLENKLKLAWIKFRNDATRSWQEITAPIKKIWDDVIGFLTDPQKRQQMIDAGLNWIKSIAQGILSAPIYLYNAARQVFTNFINYVRNLLGMNSPSKVGLALGANFGGAFGLGVEGALKSAMPSMGAVFPAAGGAMAAGAYTDNSSRTYAPQLNITSPAPANIGMGFATAAAMVSGVN